MTGSNDARYAQRLEEAHDSKINHKTLAQSEVYKAGGRTYAPSDTDRTLAIVEAINGLTEAVRENTEAVLKAQDARAER